MTEKYINLHGLIWEDRVEELKTYLEEHKQSAQEFGSLKDYQAARHSLPINALFQGHTPLTLAVQLGRKQCVRTLLDHDADTTLPTSQGFSALQEAISFGDRDMCEWIMRLRFEQIQAMIRMRTPILKDKLSTLVPDMYVEVDWRFHSWIPFITGFCPRDVCRIWKRGDWVRLDTTLVGFDKWQWQRGDMSFLFHWGERVEVWLVDNVKKVVEKIKMLDEDEYDEETLQGDLNMAMRMELMMAKLKRANADGTERVKFSPVKTGWFGTGEDEVEEISGQQCRVYDVKHLSYVSRTRKEHLVERNKMHEETLDVQLGLGDVRNVNEEMNVQPEDVAKESTGIVKKIKDTRKRPATSLLPPPPPSMSYSEFASSSEPYVHVGRKLSMKEKKKAITGRIWMATDYDLGVQQVLPLLELIAPSNKHFEKLREFVDTDLPPGFPLKLDVPLFYVLSAEVSFGNLMLVMSNNGEEDKDMLPQPNTLVGMDLFKVPGVQDGYVEGTVIRNIFKDEHGSSIAN
jgi:hypothetical protein